jgi:dsDNA-binding SOS-regulon protein
VKEVTSRKKDEEANRFTRHEVKNALLAAMGILDHLKELMQRSNVLPKKNTDEKSMFLLSDNAPMVFMDIGGDDTTSPQTKEVEEAFNELDTTLKDVMDTILDEAMAREVSTVLDGDCYR